MRIAAAAWATALAALFLGCSTVSGEEGSAVAPLHNQVFLVFLVFARTHTPTSAPRECAAVKLPTFMFLFGDLHAVLTTRLKPSENVFLDEISCQQALLSVRSNFLICPFAQRMRDASRSLLGAAGTSGSVASSVRSAFELVSRPPPEPAPGSAEAPASSGPVPGYVEVWEHLVLRDGESGLGTASALLHGAYGAAISLKAPHAVYVAPPTPDFFLQVAQGAPDATREEL